jgi:hypothetical protein
MIGSRASGGKAMTAAMIGGYRPGLMEPGDWSALARWRDGGDPEHR